MSKRVFSVRLEALDAEEISNRFGGGSLSSAINNLIKEALFREDNLLSNNQYELGYNPIKRIGGKNNIVTQLYDLAPQERYRTVEVFGGSMAYTLYLGREGVVNDLDKNLINVYRCIKQNPTRVRDYLSLLPVGRAEFNRLKVEQLPQDKYERAAAYLYLMRCSWLGLGKTYSAYTTSNDIRKIERDIQYISYVFQNITFECLSYQKLIEMYAKDGNMLFVDPPYYLNSKKHNNLYPITFKVEEHDRLSKILNQIKDNCPIMVTHYANPRYDELYRSWRKYDIKTIKYSSNKRVDVIERVYLNY